MTKTVDQIKTQESRFKQNKTDSAGNIYTFTDEVLESNGQSVAVTSLSTTTTSGYYYGTESSKDLIVLHYTAGQLVGDIGTLTAKDGHVSVSYVVARDGTIYRLFDDKYWSYHLGKAAIGDNTTDSKRSIGIEISNFGWLRKSDSKLMTYSKSHYCDTSDEAAYTKLQTAYRDHEYWATFTDEQYESVRSLLKYLTAKHAIPYQFIDEDKRHEVFSSAEDATQYKGIACHTNFRSDKWDLSPAFDWQRIYTAQPGFPTDLGDGIEISITTADRMHHHIEKEHPGGYFPIASNSMWHGGVHLHAALGAPVHSVYDGRIVAARLSDDEDQAIRHYGSVSFILVKHSVSGSRLNRAQLRGSLIGYTVIDKLYLRTKATTSAADVGLMMAGDEVELLDDSRTEADGYTWVHIKVSKSGGSLLNESGYCAIISSRLEPRRETLSYSKLDPDKEYSFYVLYMHLNREPLDSANERLHHARWIQTEASAEGSVSMNRDLVDRLRTGEVVALDIPVEAGDVLWTVGPYGSEDYRTSVLHWEIFSEENLMPSWTTVEDDDDDFNLDSEKVIGLVQSEFWENDGLLSADEVIAFYKENPKAAMLRHYTCKFVSEWSVNLDLAIPQMKGRSWYSSWGLKERLEPYMWWNDALGKSVPLPSSNKVWFYHPVSFCRALVGR